MSNKAKHHESAGISILDAVEALSDFADLEILPEVGVSEKHDLILGDQAVVYRTVQWVHQDDIEQQLKQLREVFKVVLSYLRDYYKKHKMQLDQEPGIEGIKNIMVLVGEAAKKLDRFNSVFKLSIKGSHITDWKEYRQLQDFYLHRIARHIDEGVLSKWILGLAQKAFTVEAPSAPSISEKGLQTKHLFVDLEAVKKDSEYELFFMRKEDGTRFYSPRLIRNIKLVCDFGDYIGDNRPDDPLSDLMVWQDRMTHAFAKDLYASLQPAIKEFYEIGIQHKDKEIVERLQKTVMALMLASNSCHLYRNSPPKSCLEYFTDFQQYLRETMQTRHYQHLLAYPPKHTDKLEYCILCLIQAICSGFFIKMKGYHEMIKPVQNLLREARQNISQEHLEAAKASHQLWSRLGCDHAALVKLIKRHANGPLIKVLNVLEENSSNTFDTILQGNIPCQLYSLYSNENKIDCIHLPCPIHQEQIDKVNIIEEFKAFIKDLKQDPAKGKHLIINMQDRTSWREYMRCKAIEELQYREDLHGHLVVVTLPKDTEFYHQLHPYLNDKHADVFLKHLKEQVLDENSGFFFPKEIKKHITGHFIDDLTKAIHRTFFQNKNVLLQENRLDFIELFYTFLELKLIELVQPSSFSFTCKDGIDIGSPSSTQLFAFLKLLNENKLSENEIDYMNVLLYSAPILVRERILSSDRLKRMLSAVQAFESIREEHGQIQFLKTIREAFGRFYKTNILESLVIIPEGSQETGVSSQ
jgi:hypothetical protein